MADTITLRTSTERDVVKIVERGPQGPAGGGGGEGSGTVTSVALASSDLTITGSPITTSGTITANLGNSGVTAGTYTKVTVDAKGRVTDGATATASDVGAAADVNPSVSGTLEVVDGVISCSQFGMTINAEENFITFGSVPTLNGATILREGDLGNQLVLNANGSNSGAFTGGTGGSVDVRGGNALSTGGNGGNGGSINLRGGDAANDQGGSGESGGSIDLSGSNSGAGGSINLSSGGNGNGGSINTSAGGGSINTSAGGGSIDTRGTGSIEFGVTGTRTTLTGTATADRAISLPNASGTIARAEDFAAPPAIGSTTPSTGAFTTLSASSTVSGTGFTNYFASPPAIGGTSAAAGTFTTLNANGTGAADLVAEFGTAAATRNHIIQIWGNGSGRNHQIVASTSVGLNCRLTATGSDALLIVTGTTPNGTRTNATGAYSWSSTSNATGTADLFLYRDAANTLAQYNGTNAQEKRLYGTYTSSTNYQRMTIKSVKQTLSALSGASATTTGTFIPDGAVVVGVTTRVATALTGAAGYTIGDGTDTDRWGDITGTAIGTTSDNRDWTAGTIECFTAGGNITLTAKTSNFTAGAIEICVFYLAGEAD